MRVLEFHWNPALLEFIYSANSIDTLNFTNTACKRPANLVESQGAANPV